MTKDTVIIVAGGSGIRMQSDVPKQFLLLKGIPVIFHSIDAFLRYSKDIEIIIGLPENQIDKWKELCVTYSFSFPHKISRGGSSRFLTVKNALLMTDDKGLVAIHDAVRPLVSASTIETAFRQAEKSGNAVPCIPVNDSFRIIEGNRNRMADRSCLRAIQTPQVFRKELIKKAFLMAEGEDYPDDASVLEKAGGTIFLTEGNPENIKITRASDLKFAGSLLSS